MRIRIALIFALLIGFLILASNSFETRMILCPPGYKSQIDVIYTKVNGWNGRMDLYTNQTSTNPTPIVIIIHGGGWNEGTKESQRGFGAFFTDGFAVANVEYRLADVAKAPAAIEDIRSALEYIIRHASELNIDTKRIVLYGSSAGAHLALMGGLLENDRKFDTNCIGKENMKVAAIISNYAPSDFTDKSISKFPTIKTLWNWVGEKANDESFMAAISPASYINKTSPPIFIVHGDTDPIVPYSQSLKLHQKLNKANVYNIFITVKGGNHGDFDKKRFSEIMMEEHKFLINAGILK